MKIDCHVHIGVDPLFYLQGWSPYCLDLTCLLNEAKDTGITNWVVFPFVSYMALDAEGLRAGKIRLPFSTNAIPYSFENQRLFKDVGRLNEKERSYFHPFLMADPGREPAAQVGELKKLAKTHRAYGIKIQATIIQSPIISLLVQARCILDYAEENNLPLIIHTSIDPTDVWSQCSDILQVVKSRPNVRFVLAHSCRFHHESLRIVADLANAWFDCSAHVIHCQSAVQNLPAVAKIEERFPTDYSSPRTVLKDLAEAFPKKLIWGSDAPFYSYQDDAFQMTSSYREEASVLNSLPADLLELVSHRNTLAWLGI